MSCIIPNCLSGNRTKVFNWRGGGRCSMGETSTSSLSLRFLLWSACWDSVLHQLPTPVLHLWLPCLLIIFSWAGSRCLSEISGPRRVKRQGNKNETRVFHQLSCQQGPTSDIFPQIQATPSHLRAVGSHGASYSSVCSPTVCSPWMLRLPFFKKSIIWNKSKDVGNRLCSRRPWTKEANHL